MLGRVKTRVDDPHRTGTRPTASGGGLIRSPVLSRYEMARAPIRPFPDLPGAVS